MKWVTKKEDGTKHQVRKYVYHDDGIESIWSNSWYGRHVIGQDCEWAESEEVKDDYWQKRCLAAETVLMDMGIDSIDPDRLEGIAPTFSGGIAEWQSLKQSTPSAEGKEEDFIQTIKRVTAEA